MRQLPRVATLAILALGTAAPLAIAQSGVHITDPESGSPSGAMYQIPTEGGRGDAAPGGSDSAGGEASGSANGSGTGRAPVHAADGGFGTSPSVPGVAAAPESGEARSTARGDAAGQARRSQGAGRQAGAVEIETGKSLGDAAGVRPETGSSDTQSAHRPIALLVLAAVVATGLGLLARRVARPA